MSKVSLTDAVKKAAGHGTVYSATPTLAGGAPVYEVLVATKAGKSAKYMVDGRTGNVTAGK